MKKLNRTMKKLIRAMDVSGGTRPKSYQCGVKHTFSQCQYGCIYKAGAVQGNKKSETLIDKEFHFSEQLQGEGSNLHEAVSDSTKFSGPPWSSKYCYNPALCYVYPVILTPETRGHVCQKFHHPTVFRTNLTPFFDLRVQY